MHAMLDGIKAVIFDLDGSLVDSMWMWKAIDIQYLSRYHIDMPENLQTEIEGMSFHETAVYFKTHFSIPDSIEQMKQDWNQMAWDKYTNEVKLKPGAEVFLKGCRKHGLKLGIATSNSRELTTQVLKALKLQQEFHCILTGCDVKRGKPNPDVYLEVADRLAVHPSECLVFEDIEAGIMAGKNAGMRVCAVEDAYSAPRREQKRALADAYIDDYYHLWA